MNKKGLIFGFVISFIVTFFILLAVGPIINEAASNLPLGFILQIIFPGPEDAAIGFLKAFIGAGIVSGVSSIFF